MVPGTGEIRGLGSPSRVGTAAIPSHDSAGLLDGGQHPGGTGHDCPLLGQGVLDHWKLEIASLLCLHEDVPAGVFMSRQAGSSSRSRSFARLTRSG